MLDFPQYGIVSKLQRPPLNQAIDIPAPIRGVLTPLDEVPDPVFAARIVGDGFAIDPTDGILVAPLAGEVVQLHPSRHALTLRTPAGLEILMHIGIETVSFRGQGFEAHVHKGDRVEAGARLISFDMAALAPRARSLATLVLFPGAEPGSVRLHGTLSLGASVNRGQPAFACQMAAARIEDAAVPDALVQGSAQVTNQNGLHARPAAMLARAAKAFPCEIHLERDSRRASAKSVTAILELSFSLGDTVAIDARGDRAAEAVAEIARLIASGCGESQDESGAASALAPSASAHQPASVPAGAVAGVVAAPGIAIGMAYHWRRTKPVIVEAGRGADVEWQSLRDAIARADADLAQLEAGAGSVAQRSIAGAHRALLDDARILDGVHAALGSTGKSAAYCWNLAIEAQAERMRAAGNALLRERADDILDVGARVLAVLSGAKAPQPVFPPECVAFARGLTPSDLATLDTASVIGLVLESGGPTSHVAILARAMGIPALCLADVTVAEASRVILDAEQGLLWIDPDAAAIASARASLERSQARTARDLQAAREPASTVDGRHLEVAANVATVKDAMRLQELGADGIGLLRTEFLFESRATPPDEQDQVAAYRNVLTRLGPGRRVVIRTLDAGGDKPLPFLPIGVEDNPFLGLRGVRATLHHPEIFRTQLRALLRVSGECPLHIMIPMVSGIEELRQVRAILDEETRQLGQTCRLDPVQLGIMIEVPSAALLAPVLAREADFFSIGTNDLTQYTLAMDRGHTVLGPMADPLHPAVLALIDLTVKGAHAHGKWVGVCGAMAADPRAVPILVGLDVDELSVPPAMVPTIKAGIRSLSHAQCVALARQALASGTAAEVGQLVRDSQSH